MPELVIGRRSDARYSLQIIGERDECGLSENVHRFQACVSGLVGQVDLSMMQGLLVRHDGRGDSYIEVLGMSDHEVRCKPVRVFEGEAASELIARGTDVRVRLRGRRVLFLHAPTILDIASHRVPGTRLIAALRRHFEGMDLDVVVDLGTEAGAEDFNSYFFPDMHLLDLWSESIRFLRGRWGSPSRDADEYTLGIAYRAHE